MRITSLERSLTSVCNWTFDEPTRQQFRSPTRSAPEASESHVRRIGDAPPGCEEFARHARPPRGRAAETKHVGRGRCSGPQFPSSVSGPTRPSASIRQPPTDERISAPRDGYTPSRPAPIFYICRPVSLPSIARGLITASWGPKREPSQSSTGPRNATGAVANPQHGRRRSRPWSRCQKCDARTTLAAGGGLLRHPGGELRTGYAVEPDNLLIPP